MAKTATEITRGKLTKKFLTELPTNTYLVSNVGYTIDEPIYQGRVVAKSKRENQWNELKKVSVNNRLCQIFQTKSDYKKWLTQIMK